MLCFVMALKSERVSRDWPRVCALFEASLRSAYLQTCPAVKVIVVCHEKPTLKGMYDDRVEFIHCDFEPPLSLESKACMLDKWKKLARGMVRVGELTPQFIMIMDADDLVSKRLAEFALAHPQSNGWEIRNGYFYYFGSRWILHQKDSYNCGTNAIVNARLVSLPRTVAQEEIDKCVLLTRGHTVIATSLAERGTPLQRLPFPGGVYVMAHGENWTEFNLASFKSRVRVLLRELPTMRWCSKRVRSEFGMSWDQNR